MKANFRLEIKKLLHDVAAFSNDIVSLTLSYLIGNCETLKLNEFCTQFKQFKIEMQWAKKILTD